MPKRKRKLSPLGKVQNEFETAITKVLDETVVKLQTVKLKNKRELARAYDFTGGLGSALEMILSRAALKRLYKVEGQFEKQLALTNT